MFLESAVDQIKLINVKYPKYDKCIYTTPNFLGHSSFTGLYPWPNLMLNR